MCYIRRPGITRPVTPSRWKGLQSGAQNQREPYGSGSGPSRRKASTIPVILGPSASLRAGSANDPGLASRLTVQRFLEGLVGVVAGLGVVDDEGGDGGFGVHHEAFGQRDADLGTRQE